MADDDEGPGLDLGRKIGPLPLYGWVMVAGGVGLLAYRVVKGKQATGGGSSGMPANGAKPGTQFQNSNTVTGTDASGQQYTNTYSAQGDGYLPGMLTYGAGPMPVSQGDVYVNYPAQASNPDQYNTYYYGQKELDYMRTHIGSLGITKTAIDKVQKSYDGVKKEWGQTIANQTHYHMMPDGSVAPILPSQGAQGANGGQPYTSPGLNSW